MGHLGCCGCTPSLRQRVPLPGPGQMFRCPADDRCVLAMLEQAGCAGCSRAAPQGDARHLRRWPTPWWWGWVRQEGVRRGGRARRRCIGLMKTGARMMSGYLVPYLARSCYTLRASTMLVARGRTWIDYRAWGVFKTKIATNISCFYKIRYITTPRGMSFSILYAFQTRLQLPAAS